MKILVSFLLAALPLLLNACSEDDTENAPIGTEGVFTVNEVIAKATAMDSTTLRPVALHHSNDTVIQFKTAEWKRFGPFTVASTMQKTLTNHQVILTTAEGYENAIYLCDIYQSVASVDLPAKALLSLESTSVAGYRSYQMVPKSAGTYWFQAHSDTDDTYQIATWHIIPKYTQGGERVNNALLPTDTVGPTFTYFYLQNS